MEEAVDILHLSKYTQPAWQPALHDNKTIYSAKTRIAHKMGACFGLTYFIVIQHFNAKDVLGLR